MDEPTPFSPPLAAALRNLDRKVSEAVRRFGLIADGDRILVAASGGKDSWCLLEVLAARRRWVREHYELLACHVARPGCTTPEMEQALRRRCAELGVPLRIISQDRSGPAPCGSAAHAEGGCAGAVGGHGCAGCGAGSGCTSGTGPDHEGSVGAGAGAPSRENGCFHCAWERRKLLFQTAAEEGCTKVALGHHQDDLAETVLLNLFFRGEISTMYPRQPMFDGKIVIVRPLALVEEKVLVRVAALTRGELPGCSCGGETSQRAKMKALIRELRHTCPGIKANLLRPVLTGWDAESGGHRARK